MVTMVVSLSKGPKGLGSAIDAGRPKKERGFYASCESCASFSVL
jgi:hypothetical protein